ncbi:MAG: hypothetical protein MI923_10115 [Phycisphaerales bacterium]|nr:hypothetical protein [Phycisphaerales bacterium]
MPPMYSPIRQFCTAVLPVSALLSLVCGPSPSAAYAECRDRVAQDKAEQKNAGGRDKPVNQDDSRDRSCPEPVEEQTSLSSFVAPTAAKPTEAKKTNGPDAFASARVSVYSSRDVSRLCRFNPIVAPCPLETSVYHAHAPPGC